MNNTRIHDVITDSVNKNNFSGVISIRIKGDIIFSKAYGYADRSNKIPNNLETRFGIASGTKFFTALAIGKLVQSGQLTLETKVFDIVKYDFPLYSKNITIEHLLTHTSGLPDYYDEEKVDDFNNFTLAIPWYELKRPIQYLPIFPQEKMKFNPGEKFSYCNSGYILLAIVIEQVSGMAYTEYVKQHIFNLADMKHSGFFPLNQLPENTANGYIDKGDSWQTNVYNLPIIAGGDGGAFTTVEDVYRLWDAFFNYQLLPKALVEAYVKPVISTSDGEKSYHGYGLWLYKKSDKSTIVSMVGCDPGVSFKSLIHQDKEVIITVISNTSEGAWPILNDIRQLGLY